MTKNKKFNSKKRVKYTVAYIDELRFKVKETCNHLAPSRIFDFDSSKLSAAYSSLDELLNIHQYPYLDAGTLRSFFTKEPSWNYNAFEDFLSFEERTIEILQNFVDRFLLPPLDLAEDVSLGISTDLNLQQPDSCIDGHLKKLLQNVYSSFDGSVKVTETYHIEKDGSVVFVSKEILKAHTNITHIMGEFSLLTGKVTILDAVNLQTKNKLKIYTNYETTEGFGFFVVFDNMIKKGEVAEYEITVRIENFFGELFTDKISYADHRPGKVLKYENIVCDYRFPNIPPFNAMTVLIKRHPNIDLINKDIAPVKSTSLKQYIVDMGDLTNFNTEIRVEFRIV